MSKKWKAMAGDVCWSCLDTQTQKITLKDEILQDFIEMIQTDEIENIKNIKFQLCRKCFVYFKRFSLFKRLCIRNVKLLYEYINDVNKDGQNIYQFINDNKKQDSFLTVLTCGEITTVDIIPSIDDENINNMTNQAETFSSVKENISDENCSRLDVKSEGSLSSGCENESLVVAPNKDIDKRRLKRIIKKQKNNSENNIRNKRKNIDISLISIVTLSKHQQLQELKNLRNDSEYIKAPYKCEKCAKGFAHEIVYKEHCVKHDLVSGQYVCELCSQHFNTLRNFTNHSDTHAKRYICKLCGKVVISKQNITSHMYTEHDQTNKEIKCEQCGKIYKNRYTYAKHMRIHNTSKQHKCHLCPKVFLWKDNLNRHLTRHKSEKPFKCDTCSKSFFLKENLKDHQLVHTDSKRFYCVECDLSYASQVKLNQHLKRGTRHLRPEQFTFACTLCDMRYTNNLQLSTHNDRVHLNKRSQTCHICDAAFLTKKTLETHIRSVHEGYRKPRNHMCETCGKGFSDKRVLAAHIRTHTGEKPYSCKYCSVKFAHSGAMYTHVKLVHLKLKKNTQNGKAGKQQKEDTEESADVGGRTN